MTGSIEYGMMTATEYGVEEVDQLRFEHAVMATLFTQLPDELASCLRQQYEAAVVASREFSGVGFFTNFEVPRNLPSLPTGLGSPLGDITVKFHAAEPSSSALLLVFHTEGYLNVLEGVAYEDVPWPRNYTDFTLSALQPYTLPVSPSESSRKESRFAKLKRVFHG